MFPCPQSVVYSVGSLVVVLTVEDYCGFVLGGRRLSMPRKVNVESVFARPLIISVRPGHCVVWEEVIN